MANDENATMDAMYDQAADIAGKHLNAALDEAGSLEYLVAVMMVEVAVNAAVEATSRDDIVRLLKDLARQIEEDESEEEEE
jgi:type VI protein secretion system component VasF